MQMYVGASTVALLVVPLILLDYEFRWIVSFLGILLLIVCVYPCARYFAHGETGLPTMPVFALAYAMQFAFPIFTHDDTFLLMGADVKYLAESDVTAAIVLAILGISSLELGYYGFLRSSYQNMIPVAQLPLQKRRALAYCVAMGVFLPILFSFRTVIPEEFQQPLSSILRLLQNQVLVVIAILGWLYYGRNESRFYGFWLYALVLVTAFRGTASGALEEALAPVGVFFVVKWLYTRRIPVVPIVATALVVIFLSPVKADFRERVWLGEDTQLAQQSALAKGTAWIEQAFEYWQDTLSGSRDLAEATASATDRADFIHQMAHIYSMTPSVIPYQYGRTYSFFAVALIPRIIWPDKPTAGSANGFYAVTYGVTNEEGAKVTTFGVSILGEAFLNFGIPGVVLIMMLQGILIGILHHSFGRSVSGPGGQAVFLAFFVYFLNGIGSSAEIMFGGILQNLVCGYLLLLWAKDKTPHHLRRPVSFRSALSTSALR